MRHTDSLFQFKSVNDAGVVEGIAAAFGNVDHGGDKLLFGFVTKTLTDRGSIPLPMLLHQLPNLRSRLCRTTRPAYRLLSKDA